MRFRWIWPKIWECIKHSGIFTHIDSSASSKLNADAAWKQEKAGQKKRSRKEESAGTSRGPWITWADLTLVAHCHLTRSIGMKESIYYRCEQHWPDKSTKNPNHLFQLINGNGCYKVSSRLWKCWLALLPQVGVYLIQISRSICLFSCCFLLDRCFCLDHSWNFLRKNWVLQQPEQIFILAYLPSRVSYKTQDGHCASVCTGRPKLGEPSSFPGLAVISQLWFVRTFRAVSRPMERRPMHTSWKETQLILARYRDEDCRAAFKAASEPISLTICMLPIRTFGSHICEEVVTSSLS